MILYNLPVILVLLAPIIAAFFTWRITRSIKRIWIRSLIRSSVLAAAVTPTIVPVPGLHGALPIPAYWLLISGIFGFGNSDRMNDLHYGGIPLLVSIVVIWSITMSVSFFRQDHAG